MSYCVSLFHNATSTASTTCINYTLVLYGYFFLSSFPYLKFYFNHCIIVSSMHCLFHCTNKIKKKPNQPLWRWDLLGENKHNKISQKNWTLPLFLSVPKNVANLERLVWMIISVLRSRGLVRTGWIQKGLPTSIQPQGANIRICPGLHPLSCLDEANGSHPISHASGVIHSTQRAGYQDQFFHSVGLTLLLPIKEKCR